MSRAKILNNLLEESGEFTFPTSAKEMFPVNVETAKVSLTKKLAMFGMENIDIESIEADEEGNIKVVFVDCEDNSLEVLFSYNDEDGACAIIVDPDGGKDEDDVLVDLGPLGVSFISTPHGSYIDLMNLEWLNKSTMETILTAGALLDKKSSATNVKKDAYGNLMVIPAEGYSYDLDKIEVENSINEGEEIVEVAYRVVVRGGKKVRRPIVRRKRRRRLSAKQRAGIRKSSRTRKTGKSKLKRRKSALLRKRLHLKPMKSRRGFRVG